MTFGLAIFLGMVGGWIACMPMFYRKSYVYNRDVCKMQRDKAQGDAVCDAIIWPLIMVLELFFAIREWMTPDAKADIAEKQNRDLRDSL